MSTIAQELEYLKRVAATLRAEADEAETAYAILSSSGRIAGIEDCPVNVYRYSKQIILTPQTREEARRVMRVLGGQWVKTFDEMTGQFAFDQANVLADWRGRIFVEPSASCVIEKRVEQVTSEVVRYVPTGNCGSILDDSQESL
jgi:hypothetical protein